MLSPMPDLELTRSSEDRCRYEVARVGALRLEGLFSRRGTAEAGALRWSFDRVGFWRMWKDRYALADGDRKLAIIDGRSWGRRPATITVDGPAAVDPGLLLFATYVVRSLAEDSASAAGGAAAASTAATG
jgi:hypothetical protein